MTLAAPQQARKFLSFGQQVMVTCLYAPPAHFSVPVAMPDERHLTVLSRGALHSGAELLPHAAHR